MLKDTDILKVKNRSSGTVGYELPESNVVRVFSKGQVKELTMKELRDLSFLPGGEQLLRDFLVVNNEEAAEELIGQVEPEYYYTEESVEKLLLEGSLDQLLDCLDFAPEGVIDLVKTKAIELELNDIKKREAIKDATGVDINQALSIKKQAEDVVVDNAKSQRRSAPISEESKTKTTRRYTPVQ